MGKHAVRDKAESPSTVSAMLEMPLVWGLSISPVLLMMLNTMAKTPFLAVANASGSYCITCTVGSLAGFALVALLGNRLAKPNRLRITALTATILLEMAWVIVYAYSHLDSLPVLHICTAAVCASCAVLLALWMRIGRSKCPRKVAVKYSVALMGAFVLYTLFSVLPNPIMASYAYGPIACALLLWKLSVELNERKPSAPEERRAASPMHLSRKEIIERLNLTPFFIAATIALFMVLGAALAVLAEPTPPLGAFYGLGIASLALAAILPNQTRDVLRAMGAVAGPLAIAGLCSIPLFGAGTAFAFFLAGSGIYVVRIIATIESSEISGSIPTWRYEVAALALMALCVLSGFSLTRIAAREGLGDAPVLAAIAVALVTIDALWRMLAPAQLPVSTGERPRFSEPTPPDALWLARTYALSPRETEVAAMLCENRSVGYICSRLDLATSTVKTHIARIYEKTGAHCKDDLQLLAANERDRASQAQPTNAP